MKKIYLYCSFAVFSATLFLPGKLHAQFLCNGTACTILPYTNDEMTSILIDYKLQYFDTVMTEMHRATILANLTPPASGDVNLSGNTFGIDASAGYVKEHNVTVVSPNLQTSTDLKSGGGDVIPKLFFGTNLGHLVGRSYDPFKNTGPSPPWYSPSRFDVYLSFGHFPYHSKQEVNYNFLNGNFDLTKQYKIRSHTEGIDLRYHLIEGNDLAGGPLLRFLGLSIGTGVHNTNQQIYYFNPDAKSIINTNVNTRVVWSGGEMLKYSMKSVSYPLEATTGLQLLYFFNVTATIGTSRNNGRGTLQLDKFGHVYLENNMLAAFGIKLPDAYTIMHIVSPIDQKENVNYSKWGVELNFANFKIAFDEYWADKNRGANVALRYAF